MSTLGSGEVRLGISEQTWEECKRISKTDLLEAENTRLKDIVEVLEDALIDAKQINAEKNCGYDAENTNKQFRIDKVIVVALDKLWGRDR